MTGHHLVLPHLVGHPAGHHGVDPDAHVDPVVVVGVPGFVGQGGFHVDLDVIGQGRRRGRRATGHLAVDAVDPECALGLPVQVVGHQVPVPEPEPQTDRRDLAGLAPVGEGRRGPDADGLEQLDEGRRGDHGGDRADVTQTSRPQFQEGIAPTRVAQVDAGDGKVERDLLVRFEVEVGQVERIAIDQVPVLLVAGKAFGPHRDALVAQEPLVALEGLAAGRVLHRVTRDLVRDGVEREGLLGLEQHQDEVGDALEPIELRGGLHRAEPTAVTAC